MWQTLFLKSHASCAGTLKPQFVRFLNFPRIACAGIYIDGHERPDVQEARREFLNAIAEVEHRFYKYDGEDMKQIPPAAGVKPLVYVVHDESIFTAHDGKSTVWREKGSVFLRPKGEGRSLMVSEFLCECHGPMKLTDEQRRAHPAIEHSETLVIIAPGKNADGYWRNEDLLQQVSQRLMPIFRVLHPDADALVVFDNSSNHRAFAPDALLAHRLNLKNGGKNCPKLRATTFVRGGELLTQVMQLPDGTPKGLKLILQERGLWPMDDSLDREGAMKLLAEQPDFKAQKDHLTETLESSGGGFRALFLPKFHPELNFIEFYWAAAKRYARANCDYKFDSLRATVPKALASVTLVELRNAARHCFRYMSAYAGRDGFTLSPKQVERAVKLHKSHRTIPLSFLKENGTAMPESHTLSSASSSSNNATPLPLSPLPSPHVDHSVQLQTSMGSSSIPPPPPVNLSVLNALLSRRHGPT